MSFSSKLLRFSPLAVIVAAMMIVTGCSDTLMNSNVSSTESASSPDGKIVPGDKTRHFGMLDQATYTRAGKDGEEETVVNLLVKFDGDVEAQGIIDRYGIIDPFGIIQRFGIIDPFGIIQRFTDLDLQGIIDPFGIIERFGIIDRFGIIQRYRYDNVFNGIAISIDNDRLARFLERIQEDSDIELVEPDLSVSEPSGQLSTVGQVSTQTAPWSIEAIGADESSTASGDGSGSVGVDLYVLDTGTTHDDVNVASCSKLEESKETDAGYELVECEKGDENGHGTAIASVAGAIDDMDGLVGVAPGVSVHGVKVMDASGKGTTGAVVAALDRIIANNDSDGDKKVDQPIVINLSLGADITEAEDDGWMLMDEAVQGAIDAGAVVTVAAGNSGKDVKDFSPAHVSSALTVGSYGQSGGYSSFSNYGSAVDVLAPGEDIESLWGGNAIKTYSGTSIATPHVAGAAALYLSNNPTASPSDVHDAIVNAADGSVTGPDGSSYRQLNVSSF